MCTVDWENFAVKVVSWSRSTTKKACTTMKQRLSVRGNPYSRGKCPIDDYSQRYLALLLPGSRPNTRNVPGTRLYCKHQPLKIFLGSNETVKNFHVNYFNIDLRYSTVVYSHDYV